MTMNSTAKVSENPTSPFQSHLSLMLTRRCNIRCRHCCVDALPASAREGDVARRDLENWVQQAAEEPKITYLSLTGGEPFLVYPLLRRAVDLAAGRGLPVGVVTSGFWATSPAAARRKLAPLARWGQRFSLSLSIDRFHQEYVPLARIKNAILAAHELGIEQVKVKLGYLGASAADSQARLLRELGSLPAPLVIESQLVHRTGRAARQVPRDEFAKEKERHQGVEAGDIPCNMADFPLIAPDGKVFACCGVALLLNHSTPLLLGSLHEQRLGGILDRSETNTILHFIRLYGPLQLFKRAGQPVGIQDCDATSLCSLCLKFFASPSAVAELKRLLGETVWQQTHRQVAVDRLLYRGEPAMLARLPS